MNKLRDWFTDGRRVAIQGFLATLGVLAVQVGLATEAQAGIVLVMTGALLQLAQGLLALVFLRRSDAFVWFNTVGRGLVYAFAAAAAPVAVTFGIITDDTSATILTGVSSALTAFSALLAVLNVQPTPAPSGSANSVNIQMTGASSSPLQSAGLLDPTRRDLR
ncbi:hypothetical protein [uncultured Microbacterium sp.]|uniref:hypothetical protein n=1 Tax=uncultured Microbacterium sp. TaxID=191216 RepID=UPI0025E4CBAC|nr:hypothetical protein [uncultured Microbacterium sp.]